MKYGEIYEEPSDRIRIIEFIDALYEEHPYKVIGNPESYSTYNEGWCDAIDRIISYIDAM